MGNRSESIEIFIGGVPCTNPRIAIPHQEVVCSVGPGVGMTPLEMKVGGQSTHAMFTYKGIFTRVKRKQRE